MFRLQRYLLRELLSSFILILLLITGVLFVGLVLRFMHSFPEVGLVAVIKASPAIAPIALPITLPLSFLVACLLTYGRFCDENEFLALRMGGIHPWHALAPPLAVGAVLALATFHLNATVIPLASLAGKTIGKDKFVQLARSLEDPARTSAKLGRDLRLVWQGREGAWLTNVLITGLDPESDAKGEERAPVDVAAELCRIRLDPDRDEIRIDLRNLIWERVNLSGSVDRLTEEHHWFTWPLSRETESHKNKDEDEMRLTELVYRLRHGTTDPEQLREWQVELWYRIAMSLAPLVFSLCGPALGLVTARGSRALAFVIALGVAVPIYFPLLQLGTTLGEEGTLPAWLALNLGNLTLAAGSAVLMRRAVVG